MFNFFRRKQSKETLKDRLKLVLDYDRAGLAPGQMEALKSELLKVIQKYFPAMESDYDVRLEQHGSRMVFEANLPKK
jgi:cell division topological specificity factor